jgi:hypothetical protein
MKKIIVIGNGPSVLDKPKGQFVDQFDIVTRFNNFKTEGYEKYVGSKTNYWFTWHPFKPQSENKYDKVYFHSWVKNKDNDNNYYNTLKIYPTNTIIVDHSILPEIRKIIPEYPNNAFSTGLIALHLLLKEYSEITIYGFDWWENRELHHYNDKAKRGNLHKPELEFKYINLMINEKRLKFL